ncbi:sulfite exporter TauE/SafE family protein [uncultured Psychromonas sp.]|uniref:sulfite exporter TauE/SafE family protein n=1 Tax=uncultured Psychromonas sp. TaxID=173974 RepID=UPI00260BA44D|nr:sulfite exporter TauE/SafE family protein [uncultured Psychromonas sp.]
MDIISLTLEASTLICVAIFIASVISSATGMAGGVLMFASMNQAIALQPLIAIHGMVQAFSNGVRCWLLRPQILWGMCLPFAFGALIGTAITTYFLISYISEGNALFVLLILIFYTLCKPKKLPELLLSNNQFFSVGILTGSLGIIAGAIDPLLGAFFVRNDLSKEQVVATKSMMQFIAHMIKIPAAIFIGFSVLENINIIVLFSFVAMLGTQVGVYMLKRIPNNVFFMVMKVALLLAALRISYQLIVIYY